MENKLVLVDTSILIDFFRKTDKENSLLVKLVKQDYIYCISAVTEYEIYTGTTLAQEEFWKKFLMKTNVLPFDKKVAEIAVIINRDLKKKRKLIDIADLFIGATALAHSIPIATLNESHFSRIDNLKLVY